MIYLTFSEWARNRINVPSIASCVRDYPRNLIMYADTAFFFSGNNTIYCKDRPGNRYQYTEEEKIMIVLKAQQQ